MLLVAATQHLRTKDISIIQFAKSLGTRRYPKLLSQLICF